MTFALFACLTITFYLTRSPSPPPSPSPSLISNDADSVQDAEEVRLRLETGPIALPALPSSYYADHFPALQLPESILHLPTLARGLHNFLNRPITNQSTAQHEHCPTQLADRLVNPDQYRGENSEPAGGCGEVAREEVGAGGDRGRE